MKFGYTLAAVAVAVLSLPSLASAETTVIKKFHRDGPRAEMRMHRHWHPHHDRVVIVKRHRHWH